MAWQAAPPPARPAHRRRAAVTDPEKEALRKKLAEATNTIAALDSRVLELMSQTASVRQELEARASASAALQQKLDAATQSAASLQTRLRAAEDRLSKLTAEREKTTQAMAPRAPHAPSPEEIRLEAQLQDITRRRDALITSVLRRYRELANEYRSFGTAIPATSNDRDLTPRTGPDLTRIQNTISMVEEDLRQLTGLEGQAALVRKAQGKARTP